VALMTPRQEILWQTVNVVRAFGHEPGILMGNETCRRYEQVQVVCWPTLVARSLRSEAWYPSADLVLLDEAHLALSKKMLERVLPYYEKSRVIGFTATPARTTGHGLGTYFTDLLEIVRIPKLIEEGFLVPGKYFGGQMADMSKVKTTAGDYNQKQSSEENSRAVLIGDVVANWMRLAGDRHTVVFAVDIRHANALAEKFQEQGVSVGVVTNGTSDSDRMEVIQKFRDRDIQVLCNVMVAAYGFDVPTIDCIVLARPTKSIPLHLQMLGRGLRPSPGKEHCMMLDHSGNVTRLGTAEDDYEWCLSADYRVQDSGRFQKGGERKDKPVTCQQCKHIFRRSPVCPNCGWQIPAPKKDVAHVEADLVEITQTRIQEWIDKRTFYLELLYLSSEGGWHPKRAACVYRDKFDQWPARKWNNLAPIEATDKTRRFVKSRVIAFAKARKR
jgi:superfamily II DNA or RNA helicase